MWEHTAMRQDRWQQGQELLKPVLPSEKIYDISTQMGYREVRSTLTVSVLSLSHIRAKKLHRHRQAVCELNSLRLYVKRT